jgi:hypothetical protein
VYELARIMGTSVAMIEATTEPLDTAHDALLERLDATGITTSRARL